MTSVGVYPWGGVAVLKPEKVDSKLNLDFYHLFSTVFTSQCLLLTYIEVFCDNTICYGYECHYDDNRHDIHMLKPEIHSHIVNQMLYHIPHSFIYRPSGHQSSRYVKYSTLSYTFTKLKLFRVTWPMAAGFNSKHHNMHRTFLSQPAVAAD